MEIRVCFLYSDRFYFWAMRHIVFHRCFVLFVQSTLFLTQQDCNRNQAKQATAQRSQTLGGPWKHLAVFVTTAEIVRAKEMSWILLRSCREAQCQILNAIIFQYQYLKYGTASDVDTTQTKTFFFFFTVVSVISYVLYWHLKVYDQTLQWCGDGGDGVGVSK